MSTEKENRTEAFNIRVTPSKKARLISVAERNMRTATKEIEFAIDRHLAQEEKKK